MRYAVALYLEDHRSEPNKTKTMLQQYVVRAKNKDEALGMVVRNPQRPYQNYGIIFHLVTEVGR